tara:strand:- start:538 stop:642 length:105 start_codon:yes stop_codon:yes gene_type:complete
MAQGHVVEDLFSIFIIVLVFIIGWLSHGVIDGKK